MNNIPYLSYLRASENGRALWRNKLRDVPKPCIGLVWAGSSDFSQGRSLNICILQPLIDCGATHFVSLQKDGTDKIADIFDAAPYLQDFSDTAALIVELDVVITVDTAVAHLAGAMGKPVWILLPFNSDWRWFLGREDSPWYPTARLFRQKNQGDWARVIESVTQKCRNFINGDHRVLQTKLWNGEVLRQNPNALPLK